MLHVKSWARKYLIYSPIFKSALFGLPHQQKIMQVNSHLLSAYCLSMFKNKHYDQLKVNSILGQNASVRENYSIKLVKMMVRGQMPDFHSEDDENQQKIKEKKMFLELLSKLFHRNIVPSQFAKLCDLYLSLKLKEEVTEMEDFILDISFYEIDQLSMFAQIQVDSAIQAMGAQSISLLEKSVKQKEFSNIFDYVLILRRLKEKISDNSTLVLLDDWLSIDANFKELIEKNKARRHFLMKRSLFYMLWLLHIQDLGQFTEKYVKNNYFYSLYIKNSLSVIWNLIQCLDIKEIKELKYVILVNQIVIRMQNLQEKMMLFQNTKKNIVVQGQLRKMKKQVHRVIENYSKKTAEMDHFAFLKEVNELQIDFIATSSRNFIKNVVQSVIENPHLKILIDSTFANTLFSLNHKADCYELNKMIQHKVESKNKEERSLLEMLEGFRQNQEKKQCNMRINNIYELARIKRILALMKIKQQKYPQFSQEEYILLSVLLQQLSFSSQQLRSTPHQPLLNPLFILFMK